MANKYVKGHIAKPELEEKILEVTIDLFYKQGIKQVRMDDIAKTLSISKRTLYEIFKDKETLLMQCIKREHEKRNEYMQQLNLSQSNVLEIVLHHYQYTIEMLPHINPVFFEDLKKYPSVMSPLRDKRVENLNHAVDYFNEGIKQGIFKPEVNMELFIRLLNLTTDKCIESDIYKTYPITEIYRAIFFTFLRGIATDKGLQIIEEFIHKAKNENVKMPQAWDTAGE